MVDPNEILSAARLQIEELCTEYRVRRLQLFGSAAKGGWNGESSDFDFVVEFDRPPEGMHLADQYFDFKEKLEGILGRTVDLVELRAVRNPYFRREIERTSKEWYAA